MAIGFLQTIPAEREDGFDGSIREQRIIWSKRTLKLWLTLYLTFWGLLTITLGAGNDLLGTSVLALVVAFVGSFILTLLFMIPHMTIARFYEKQVTPDEILLAVTFGMGILLIIPGCLSFEFGYSVMLASILALFQGLILMSRYSQFREKLTTDTSGCDDLVINTLDNDALDGKRH